MACCLTAPSNHMSQWPLIIYGVLWHSLNTLRPRQNGRHFPDDSLKWIFLNENAWISIEVSMKFVPNGPINNIPSLVQIMAWRRPGDKPLSEPMLVSLLTHICVTRPQWVKTNATRVYQFEKKLKNTLIRLLPHLRGQWVNSLWPRDTIWRHISGSTLVQVMACCLTAPSHYLNQCWLIISKVQRYSAEKNFTRNNPAISH